MNKNIRLLGLLILCFSCDYYDGRLQIVNQSDKIICFETNNDTTLNIPSGNHKEYYLRERIQPGDTNRVVIPGSKTKWIMEVTNGRDSTLSVFVFDYEQVLKNDWDSLIIKRDYKRLDYKLKELNKNNWIVIVR